MDSSLLVALFTLAFVILAESTILGLLWFMIVPATRRTKAFFDAFTMEEMDSFTEWGVAVAREMLAQRKQTIADEAALRAEMEGRR